MIAHFIYVLYIHAFVFNVLFACTLSRVGLTHCSVRQRVPQKLCTELWTECLVSGQAGLFRCLRASLCNTNIPVCGAKDSRCLALCLKALSWPGVSFSLRRNLEFTSKWEDGFECRPVHAALKKLYILSGCVTTQMCESKPLWLLLI